MPPAWLLLLLGAVRWTASYTIVHKESLPRVYRGPYEDWRPVSDAATSYQRTRHATASNGRYPVHYKGYALGPPKKPSQQSAEHSQNVQVFSPAPPTILGSFSVFGHATVNAREPASHIAKKPVKQTPSLDYPSLETEQTKYHRQHPSIDFGDYTNTDHVKRPQRYNSFDQTYFYDDRRTANREGINKATHAQSTSLNPNSYYYDQSQPFHASNVDNSYHKARRPQKNTYSQTPYRGGDFAVTTEDYRTSIDPYNVGSYYNSYKSQKNQPSVTPYYDRLPFGDITIGGSSQAHKGHAKDIYNQYSHLSRPFQNTQTYSPVDPLNVPTYPPFVTTFSAPNLNPARVKFSEVAQPFQIENKYHHQSTYTPRPSYIVTQQPYAEDAYPYAVTTIGVPTNTQQKLEYSQSSLLPSPRPHVTTSGSQFGGFTSHKPGHGVSHNSPSFLPTPSSEDHSLVIEPTPDNQPTPTPQDPSTVENKDQELSTGDLSTWMPSETTTTERPTTTKSRRRPSRPSHGSRNQDNRLKNHKVSDEVSSDAHKPQRRRKPSNRFRENSEYKRTRTSTTTSTTEVPTQAPAEHTEEHFVDTTDSIIYGETYKDTPDESLHKMKHDAYDVYQQPYFHPEKYPAQDLPENELFSPPNENHFQFASSTTAEPVTTPLQTTTARRTTPTSTSAMPPVSVTSPTVEPTSNSITSRLKNKYGNNRPRFSVKDYRERLNKATSTSSPQANTDVEPPKTKNDNSRARNRGSHRATSESTVETDDSTTEATSRPRKFKPRYNPSRNFYKTSTTQRPDTLESTTTTERPNTFRPSTNRYKPGTGKYYSRYKTSSLPPKEVDDSPVTTTARVVIKPKGVFSAKRRPSLKKTQEPDAENETVSEEMTDPNHFGDMLKTNENEVAKNVFNKKMDDAVTTIVSSEEVQDPSPKMESPSEAPVTTSSTSEASSVSAPLAEDKVVTVADLTSSSSNDYKSSSVFRRVHSNRRPMNKFVIPSEEPILPLEAFFQTRHN